VSRSTLGPTQLPSQWLGVPLEYCGRGVHLTSHSICAEDKNEWSYNSALPCLNGMHRDNFTFSSTWLRVEITKLCFFLQPPPPSSWVLIQSLRSTPQNYRVKSPNMTVISNAGCLCIFPVCFRHVVVSLWPCSRCLVTPYVRRTGLSDDVCSSYELWYFSYYFGEPFSVRFSIAQV
jgi:hypothetical protein